MGKNLKKKATHKTKFTMGGKTIMIETALFQPTGHVNYSGFGIHGDKNRNAERRNRKIEEKRVMRGDWE
jgi:hypothetical protein